MISITNPLEFAQETFGKADLGDARRTQRLVDAAAVMAKHPGASIPAACDNNSAQMEGFYKLLRNEEVEPEAVRRAFFDAAAEQARKQPGDILLIQDTTSVSPVHALRELLRTKVGSPAGYQVHTGFLVDANTAVPLGILGQIVWSRTAKKSKKMLTVESEKWQRLDEQTFEREIDQNRLIRVADRESDIHEYIEFLDKKTCRFILRSTHDRRIVPKDTHDRLIQSAQNAPIFGTRTINIEQRGAQKKGLEQSERESRTSQQVTTILRATRVELKGKGTQKTLSLNVVHVTSDDGKLTWILLTREPIDTLQNVERIVRYYETRWLIEQFHKSWKSGCKIEERRMGSLDNFLRIMAITTPIAVRLLRLQILANMPEDDAPATEVLSESEIKVLWRKVERSTPPQKTPSCKWAYRAIAKLAGWQDSKRTGRVGIDTLWRGIERLAALAEGWELARDFKR